VDGIDTSCSNRCFIILRGSVVCGSDSPNEQELLKHQQCIDRLKASYGTFGDAFGAVNSLFSGLALAGVVLALFFQSEGTKRSSKPFVVPILRRGDNNVRITVTAPARVGGIVSLPLVVSLPLQNSSGFPALNIDARLEVDGVSDAVTNVIDVPLAAKDEAHCTLAKDVVGGAARTFVEEVCGTGKRITLCVEYDSVEGIRWRSQASYLLTVSPNRPDDVTLLQEAIDGAPAAVSTWTAESTVDLDFTTISGSWHYEEVRPRKGGSGSFS
jgi:hypothetical protein